jgi:phosphomannomutase
VTSGPTSGTAARIYRHDRQLEDGRMLVVARKAPIAAPGGPPGSPTIPYPHAIVDELAGDDRAADGGDAADGADAAAAAAAAAAADGNPTPRAEAAVRRLYSLLSELDRIVFKAYDVRGTVPDQLDARACRAIGWAFARFAGTERLVVARDMRASGEALSAAFIAGARVAGANVVDIGLASTDTMYFASGRLDAPGAMFTASHNPAAYNGIKFCLAGALPVGEETGLTQIRQTAEQAIASDADAGEEAGSYERRDLLSDYATHVRSFVDLGVLRPLTIVADTANGMGGLVAPEVFAGLPFKVVFLFPELDGTSPTIRPTRSNPRTWST